MTNRLRILLLAAATAAAGAARADTVQASSTTLLLGRQDWRDGALQTAVPLYELVTVDASDIKAGFADLEIALSTWGSADLADVRFWQNGAQDPSRFTGDVNVGYVRAAMLDRALTLQVGRQMISEGIARMVQVDGASARVELPAGFAASGYYGAPVSPRFATRGGDLAVGNVRATSAGGGRLSWQSPGLLEVGASFAIATDSGDPSRQDVGVDFRLTPHPQWQLAGAGWLDTYESRIGEASLAATWYPVRLVDVTLDYRHVEPDLFLARDSILSVFVADKRNEVGGLLHYGGLRWIVLDADYHLIADGGIGHRARAKGTAHPMGPSTSVGAELTYLKSSGDSTITDNGYEEVRLFGAHEFTPRITGTADLMAYFFQQDVNGQSKSLAATATVAYGFARGWKAALAGTAGSTPFMESQFEIMAKLVYEQTYSVREVK